MNLAGAWAGVLDFIKQNVTMPNASPVPSEFVGKLYPRYKAPHVHNQPHCTQLPANLPGTMDDQEVYGCDVACTSGCILDQPSIHNPGPSFANSTHSVNLVRVHKATVHFTSVRALLILQRELINDTSANEVQRHTFGLARVLMRPSPGNAWTSKSDFRSRISTGNYSQNATGVWRMWQTGTIGLRTMDLPASGGPSPNTLTFRGVTDMWMDKLPGQLDCWVGTCLGQPNCGQNQSLCS